MSDRDVSQAIHQAERAPSVSQDGHTRNFEGMYQSIVQMQQHDGGSNSAQYHQDLQSMNERLHARGVMPNVQIMGVDERNHALITRDVSSHRDFEQEASHVNDFRMLGSTGDRREQADAARFAMRGIHGIERN